MINPGTLVKDGTSREGLVCEYNPAFSTCEDGDTPSPQVFFFSEKNQSRVEEVPKHQLTVIGQEEPVATLEGCGADCGKDCCAFLSVASGKPNCERAGKLRAQMIRANTGKRFPGKKYPHCQLPISP